MRGAAPRRRSASRQRGCRRSCRCGVHGGREADLDGMTMTSILPKTWAIGSQRYRRSSGPRMLIDPTAAPMKFHEECCRRTPRGRPGGARGVDEGRQVVGGGGVDPFVDGARVLARYAAPLAFESRRRHHPVVELDTVGVEDDDPGDVRDFAADRPQFVDLRGVLGEDHLAVGVTEDEGNVPRRSSTDRSWSWRPPAVMIARSA